MKHVHILGVCGTFMGGIAAIAREAGYRSPGSDRGIYPPMSEQLTRLGIDLIEGFEAEQPIRPRRRGGRQRDDPRNARGRGSAEPADSLHVRAEWLAATVLRERRVVAVSGTHGKTTTTSLLAWILQNAGREAGYLIGGAPVDFGFLGPARQRSRVRHRGRRIRHRILRQARQVPALPAGDADRQQPGIRSADIYPDLQAIVRQFHQLVRSVPGNGRLIAGRRCQRGCPAETRLLDGAGAFLGRAGSGGGRGRAGRIRPAASACATGAGTSAACRGVSAAPQRRERHGRVPRPCTSAWIPRRRWQASRASAACAAGCSSSATRRRAPVRRFRASSDRDPPHDQGLRARPTCSGCWRCSAALEQHESSAPGKARW